MKKLLFIPLLFIALSINAQETEKEIKIAELLEISGSGSMGQQLIDRMFGQFKEILPDIPEVFWDEAISLMDPYDFMKLMIPIYDKHFTLDDILALIEFYNSPVGRKLVENQASIMEESMNIGEIWGQEIGQKVIEKLEASGY